MLKNICILSLVFFVSVLFAQEEISASSDDLITKVVISPKIVILFSGETAYFTFRAFTAQNEEIPAAFSWRFSGGKLLHDGRFIAGEQPGEFELEATSPNGIKEKARIIIKEVNPSDNTPTSVKIIPDKIHLKPGEKCQFTFAAYNKSGKKVPAPLEISYGGGKLDNKGNFIAGNQDGKYKFKVSIKNGPSAEAKVFIGNIATSEHPPVYIKVLPQRVSLYPGEKVRFSFKAYDKLGQEVDCDLSIACGGGKVNNTGEFVAGKVPGRYEFQVNSKNGMSGKAKIHILNNSNATQNKVAVEKKDTQIAIFSIKPRFVRLQPGQKQQFTFEAVNRRGEQIAPQVNIQFSGGKFSADGAYVAGERPGNYKIVATTDQGQKTEASIQILGEENNAQNRSNKPKSLHKILLSPQRKRIRPREQIQFDFSAVDRDGNKVPTSLSWSYQGGRLTAEGLYTAGYGFGQHYVTLTGDNGIKATSLIAIVPHNDEYIPPVWIELLPRQATIRPGETKKFKCRVFNDQDQFLGTSKITWEFYGGTWDPNTMIFTAGNKTGDFYLRARYGGSEYVVARSHIEVK